MKKPYIRQLVLWLALLVFAWIAIINFSKTQKIVLVLLHGQIGWIILAILIQVAFYFIYPSMMKKTFDLFKLGFSRRNLGVLYLASKFTDIISPSSMASKIALFATVAKTKQKSGNLMLGSTILLLIFDTVSFLIISLPIVLFLIIKHSLPQYVLISYFLLAFISLSLLGLLSLILQNRARRLTRLLKLPLLAKFFESLHQINADATILKMSYINSLALGILCHFLNILTLVCIFLAFGQSLHITIILASYLAGVLFTILSITPQGVGSAEPLMILTMTGLGVPLEQSAVVTLAFRGLLFWLPLFPGFIAFRHISKEA